MTNDTAPTKLRRQPVRQSKPDTVAQYYQRADGRWTFRVPGERRPKPARDYVGHNEGWSTHLDVCTAILAAGIKHYVPIDAP